MSDQDHKDNLEEIVIISNDELNESKTPIDGPSSKKTKAQERLGLSDAEAEAQYVISGYNELPVMEIPLWKVFLQQFTGTMPYMLELAIIISAAVQDFANFGIILAMVRPLYIVNQSCTYILICFIFDSLLLMEFLASLRS